MNTTYQLDNLKNYLFFFFLLSQKLFVYHLLTLFVSSVSSSFLQKAAAGKKTSPTDEALDIETIDAGAFMAAPGDTTVNLADISVGAEDFESNNNALSSDLAGAVDDLDVSIDIGKDENVFGGAKTPTAKGKGKTPGMRQTAMAGAVGAASEHGFDGLFDKFVKRRLSEKFKQGQSLVELPKSQLDEEKERLLQEAAKKKRAEASLAQKEKEKERERQKQLEREKTVKVIHMMREKEKKEKERKEQEKARFASVLTPTKKRPSAEVSSAAITRLQVQEADTSVDVEEVSVLIEIPIVNIDEEIDNLVKSKFVVVCWFVCFLFAFFLHPLEPDLFRSFPRL